MLNLRDYISFTCDVRKFVNVLAQDPTVRAEINAGLTDAPLPLTTALGAANLTAQEGVEPTWCSLFPATVQGKASGEAFCYRNDSRGGRGDRIQLRLRKQPKRQAVDALAGMQAAAVTPGAALPRAVTAQDVMTFLANLGIPGSTEAVASDTVPNAAPVAGSAAAAIPPDIADRIGILYLSNGRAAVPHIVARSVSP